ncbi:MAG: class D sortase [Oscillospiraceae bacterium]|nr:class D sortase [Oscillospiraceae bacterium]
MTQIPNPDIAQGSAMNGYTEVTNDLYYSNGSLGTLKIPTIGLTVKVYQGTDSAALAKGAGHFKDTSIWDGNVCVAGHNRGVTNHFGKIHTLKMGDTITLTTRLGKRTYAVTGVEKVSVNDSSGTAATTDNRVTLYTCVMNQPEYRWCVTAVELT